MAVAKHFKQPAADGIGASSFSQGSQLLHQNCGCVGGSGAQRLSQSYWQFHIYIGKYKYTYRNDLMLASSNPVEAKLCLKQLIVPDITG